MASIKKRGPWQWQARIRKKGYSVQIKTFDTKREAQAWASEIESEMGRGVFVSRVEAESTTLEEALERYKRDYIRQKLKHPQQELSRADHLIKSNIGPMYLARIRGKDIADYISKRNKEVKPNTVRLDLALLSRLFEVAAKDWGMESLANPVKRTTKPKIPQGRERRLKEGEEEILLKNAHPKLKNIILFALETAMRRSEIARLTWDNVNLQKRIAFLLETKNASARSVPLSPEALRILKAQRKVTSLDKSVFGVTPDFITHKFQKACKDSDIKDLRFHDLRHEATSRLFENTDLDTMEIKQITGHKNMQMLARYSHLRSERLADRLAGKKRGA